MKNPPLSKRKTATYLLFPGILATIYVWMWMWGMGLRLKRGRRKRVVQVEHQEMPARGHMHPFKD